MPVINTITLHVSSADTSPLLAYSIVRGAIFGVERRGRRKSIRPVDRRCQNAGPPAISHFEGVRSNEGLRVKKETEREKAGERERAGLSPVHEETGTRECASEKGLRKGRVTASRNSAEESGEELPP